MAIPKKRRGFRRIVVDSIDYNWRFDNLVDIRLVAKPRNKLLIDINWEDPWLNMRENYQHHHISPCDSPISPKFVASAIAAIKKIGWQPTKDYGEFYIKYQNGEFSQGKINQSSSKK